MTLAGLPLLGALVGALLLAAAVAVIVYRPGRVRPGRPARVARLLLVLTLATAVTADALTLRTSHPSVRRERAALSAVALSSAALRPPAAHTDASQPGRMVPFAMPGRRSGISRPGYVYLPAAYFTRPTEHFPVIELLHGYSGSPNNWIYALPIATVLNREIAAGRMRPVIAVAPKEYDTNDGECVNAVRGEQNETYLTQDVSSDVAAHYPTAPDWATIGFSTGGYCAVNLALHHQNVYRAAVSLSGFFTAILDNTTGDLYHGDQTARNYNSPTWFVQHHPVNIGLYLYATTEDGFAYPKLAPFRRVVPAGTDLTVVTAPGAHNATAWNTALPAALDWIGRHLPAPAPTAN